MGYSFFADGPFRRFAPRSLSYDNNPSFVTLTKWCDVPDLLFWTLNVGVFYLLYRVRQVRSLFKDKTLVALLLWVVIPSLYFIIGHYAKGYALLVWPAIVILLAHSMLTSKQRIARSFPALLIGVSLLLFFFVPYVEPSTSLAVERGLSFSQRVERVEARALSHFLMSTSRIERNDRDFFECSNLLRQSNAKNGLIIIDGTSGTWIFPKAIAFEFPFDTLIDRNARGNGTVKFYSGGTTISNYPSANLSAAGALLLWQDTHSPQIPIVETESKLGQRGCFGLYAFKDFAAFHHELQILSP